MSNQSKCKGCGKAVIFATDEKGHRQILDAVAPVYRLLSDGSCRRVPHGGYVSHFATCSKANEFGKDKKP